MQQKNILYQSGPYTLYADRVVQGRNRAEALSPTHLRSNYKSPASETFSRLITFKFSINEKDNELPPNVNHWVTIRDDEHESPVITFGEAPPPLPDPPLTYLPINYEYTFRVDVSPVLQQFEEQGFYEIYDGTQIAAADFKGFYLAGGSAPLSWDFVTLAEQGLRMRPTDDPNIYSLTVRLNPYDPEDYEEKEWRLSRDLGDRPRYSSGQPIVDALFNLSLEEALRNIEPDGTLRTGAKWVGVWTRDISYSIVLAFAYHEPEAAKTSLRRKVRRGRIVQDTGSGGAWPVSTDRTTWVLAAWEIYKVTGDADWLDEVYPIIKNTLEDDYLTIRDSETGLYRGESSFLDWREQTYPKWMNNTDIFVSECLGTNAVHYQAHRILAAMARLKGEPAEEYLRRAEGIKQGINDYLWLPDKGYYAQYLYGRPFLTASPRIEALGEALAILFGVADGDQTVSIISRSPLTDYGASCIYPQIPGIPPYHNNAIWPFVQAYWNLAAAKAGNEAVLNHGLASIYRAAALFLTNYENMVAGTGDFLGTEINSERMLWSMAGNLAMVHRVFMGMEFELEGLYLRPAVPRGYAGEKRLTNFNYRQAILDISVRGFGNQISRVTMDGKPLERAFVPTDLTGKHEIVIELANNHFDEPGMNQVANYFSLPTPLVAKQGERLNWQPITDTVTYRVYRNGHLLTETTETDYAIVDDGVFALYQVSAVDEKGYESFLSEPVGYAETIKKVELEEFASAAELPYTNFSGSGFVAVSLHDKHEICCEFEVEKAGDYLLDVRFSNGHGPLNSGNQCAIRSLTVNGDYRGALVFPQRGTDEWSDWGFSNTHTVSLRAGKNTVTIHFADWNHNMNGEVNGAMLDFVRVMPI